MANGSKTPQEEAQESLNNLRRSIKKEKRPEILKQHRKMLNHLLRVHRHLGVR